MITLAISLCVFLSKLIKGSTHKTTNEQVLEKKEQMDSLKNIKKGTKHV